jgi:hypothetical protein
MKKTLLLVLLAPFAMLSAYAQTPAASAMGKTRAEVKAETQKEGTAGNLNKSTDVIETPKVVGGKPRAEVKAETQKDAKAGSPGKPGEVIDDPKIVGGKARAEVKAATQKEGKAGNLNKSTEVVDPAKAPK